MTMREKMARAMLGSMLAPAKYFSGADVAPEMCAWERWDPGFRARWLTAADAALDALLEPTEGMTDAAFDVADATISRDELRAAFVAHVRAAKDGK